MRKLFVTVAASSVVAAAAFFVPAHAANPGGVPSSGCITDATDQLGGAGPSAGSATGNVGGGAIKDDGISCSYTANGGSTQQYVIATPNSWSITDTYSARTCTATNVCTTTTKTVIIASGVGAADGAGSSSYAPGKQGSFTVHGPTGGATGQDTITLTINDDCAPGNAVCGAVGFVAAGQPS